MSGTFMLDVKADLGPLILGGLFAFGLSGCVNMQFIMYWQIYPGERWSTKSLVIAIWFLDLCHSALMAVAIWDSVIVPYGDFAKADVFPWSIAITIQLTVMTTFLVQSFFAYRIYILHNREVMVASLVLTLAFVRLLTTTLMIVLKSYTALMRFPPIFILATLGLALSALVDILIMGFLCSFLRMNRIQIPRSSMNRTIDTLTLWTIQSGSITCLGAVVSLAFLAAMPQYRIFTGIHFAVGKLYANSLLATFNARTKLRQPLRRNMASLLAPISIILSENRSEEDAHETLGFQRRLHSSVGNSTGKPADTFTRHPTDLNHIQSVELNVRQASGSKYHETEVDVVDTGGIQ